MVAPIAMNCVPNALACNNPLLKALTSSPKPSAADIRLSAADIRPSSCSPPRSPPTPTLELVAQRIVSTPSDFFAHVSCSMEAPKDLRFLSERTAAPSTAGRDASTANSPSATEASSHSTSEGTPKVDFAKPDVSWSRPSPSDTTHSPLPARANSPHRSGKEQLTASATSKEPADRAPLNTRPPQPKLPGRSDTDTGEPQPSAYRGVVLQPNGRWGAQIYDNHSRVWLGTFNSELEAAQAYDRAAVKFRGRSALLNFKHLEEDELEYRFIREQEKEKLVDMLRRQSYNNELLDSQGQRRSVPAAGSDAVPPGVESTNVAVNAISLAEPSSTADPADKAANQESQHLFEKAVTPSDVGKLNRLVIPKLHAERCFPLDLSVETPAKMLAFLDENNKTWNFRYSYWNSSQSYVLTKGWSRFVKEKQLTAGDIIVFKRTPDNKMHISYKRKAAHLMGDFLSSIQGDLAARLASQFASGDPALSRQLWNAAMHLNPMSVLGLGGLAVGQPSAPTTAEQQPWLQLGAALSDKRPLQLTEEDIKMHRVLLEKHGASASEKHNRGQSVQGSSHVAEAANNQNVLTEEEKLNNTKLFGVNLQSGADSDAPNLFSFGSPASLLSPIPDISKWDGLNERSSQAMAALPVAARPVGRSAEAVDAVLPASSSGHKRSANDASFSGAGALKRIALGTPSDQIAAQVKDPATALADLAQRLRSGDGKKDSTVPRVKCFVQGTPVGVSIDLSRFNSTEKLKDTLLATTGGTNVVYQDADDDMILLGDESWEYFLKTVKKMYIRT